MSDPSEKLAEENPFSGASLVLYSASAEDAEVEPATDVLQELGLISWSLWARFEEDGVELPIVGEASNHIWYSLSSETFHPDPATPVSEEFALAVVQMMDGDEEWGEVDDEVWEALPDLERYLFNLLRHGFVAMEAAEPALVIDWCQRNAPDPDEGDGDD